MKSELSVIGKKGVYTQGHSDYQQEIIISDVIFLDGWKWGLYYLSENGVHYSITEIIIKQ